MRRKKQVEQEFKVIGHIYIPKHEVLSKEDAERVFRTYNAKSEQFPYILESDPVMKEIGAKPGNLIRISRRSETAGETSYYRLVVEG